MEENQLETSWKIGFPSFASHRLWSTYPQGARLEKEAPSHFGKKHASGFTVCLAPTQAAVIGCSHPAYLTPKRQGHFGSPHLPPVFLCCAFWRSHGKGNLVPSLPLPYIGQPGLSTSNVTNGRLGPIWTKTSADRSSFFALNCYAPIQRWRLWTVEIALGLVSPD